ncbi:MAG: DUF21 domain-containing protein [Planctomycetota bacterium]
MLLSILLLLICLLASALYSGAETAFYSLSKLQLEVEAERGSRAARWARWLSRDDAGLLIVVLIGNNLAIQLATWLGEKLGADVGLSHESAALAVGFWLTPVAFSSPRCCRRRCSGAGPTDCCPWPCRC